MSNSIYSSGKGDYTYVSGVNDSCISFRMEKECEYAGMSSTDAAIYRDIDSALGPADDGSGIAGFNGLIAQQIQCSCARQPTIVYEIGTKNYYAVDAKPQGTGRLQNILGPTKESIQSLSLLGDICNPTRIVISIIPCSCFCNPDLNPPTPLEDPSELIFTGGFLTNVTLAASAKDLVVQGSWDFLFQDLQNKTDN